MRDFTKYEVWQKAIELAEGIYALTKQFPTDEKWGLTSQLRRAAVSISSNIAEGASRSSEKDFLRFIEIACGSAFEVKSQLFLAKKLSYISEEEMNDVFENLNSVIKMILSLRNKLRN